MPFKLLFVALPFQSLGAGLLAGALIAALIGCAGAPLTPPPIAIPVSAATDKPAAATPAPTVVPSPAAFVPSALRLTQPGCCVQPFWSEDSRAVQFFDRPEGGALGIYEVSVNGGAPVLVNEQVGVPSPDGRYLAFRDRLGQTIVRELATETDSVIDNGGLPVYLSPNSQRLAWAESAQVTALATRSALHVATIDGSDARQIITVFNGGIAGWLDDDHLLVAGRKEQDAPEVSLFSVDVTTDEQANIASEQRMRSVRVAPGGKWILYAVTLNPDNAAHDGLWVVSADGNQRFKLDVVGSAQWRDSHRLLVIPLEVGAPSHRLWQFDAETGEAGAITDPAITPFRVAGGEWSVSPDGKYMVFLNEDDEALWLMGLPPLER